MSTYFRPVPHMLLLDVLTGEGSTEKCSSLVQTKIGWTSRTWQMLGRSRELAWCHSGLGWWLQVGQSHLNSHGFKTNLKEDDIVSASNCYRSESTSHSFLYQGARESLFNQISQELPRFYKQQTVGNNSFLLHLVKHWAWPAKYISSFCCSKIYF